MKHADWRIGAPRTERPIRRHSLGMRRTAGYWGLAWLGFALWINLVPAPSFAHPGNGPFAAAHAEPSVAHPHPQGQSMEARFFVLSESCARCHTALATSTALWNEAGEDASPIGTWSASVMANSFRDPYWRAQIEREIAAAPEAERAEISALCTRCHAPAAVHEARFEGLAPPTLAQLDADPAAAEGVTCTICHRMTGEGLGTKATFDGHLPLDFQNRLYGPYREPFDGPMAAMSGYQVQFGQHTVESSLCATCHTLETAHGGAGTEAGTFLEQSPYLEWRNSVFSYEDGTTEESRSCQACHMPDMGAMTLAHNPAGRDFPFLTQRTGVRSHAIVGGNALLLDMLAAGREELGVTASVEALQKMAEETRTQLAEQAAHVEVGDLDWREDRLSFSVFVENLTGHKLPTGYPSRRVWLEVQVSTGETTWFASGVPDAEGRILPVGQGMQQPHHDRITQASQVQIYEMIAKDSQDQPTTQLSAMRARIKDNRLLPKGWRLEGPHGHETAPAGIGEDANFVGSLDRVTFDLEIPAELRSGAGRPRIDVRLLYQSIPPAWADDHRPEKGQTASAAATRFLKLYDQAPTRYEVLAESTKLVR